MSPKLSANDRFEIKAKAFQSMTGLMAPGKDAFIFNQASYDERMFQWEDWSFKNRDIINALINAFEWHMTL